jgi:hypothetical protein
MNIKKFIRSEITRILKTLKLKIEEDPYNLTPKEECFKYLDKYCDTIFEKLRINITKRGQFKLDLIESFLFFEDFEKSEEHKQIHDFVANRIYHTSSYTVVDCVLELSYGCHKDNSSFCDLKIKAILLAAIYNVLHLIKIGVIKN